MPFNNIRSVQPQQQEVETEDQRLGRKAQAMGLTYESRSGGGANMNDPVVAKSIKEISSGLVDQDTVKIWQKRNPRVAGVFGKALEFAQDRETRKKKQQQILGRNIYGGTPDAFQQQGPVQQGQPDLPEIPASGPSFNQQQALQMATQQGALTPEFQAQTKGLAESFAPPSNKAASIGNAGEFELPNRDKVRAFLDKESRQWIYRDKQGNEQPLPYGARKVTPSSTGQEKMKPKQLLALRTEMADTENGVRTMTGYMKRVAKSPHGIELLVNKWVGKAKTMFGGDLSPENLSVLEQQGKLQGLLGKFRKEVVGPGVMTEYDAKRVIMAMGGEPDATRHPEIVRRLLAETLQSKIESYNKTLLPMYRDQRKRGGAYTKKLKALSMPKAFTTPLVNKPSAKRSVADIDAEIAELESQL